MEIEKNYSVKETAEVLGYSEYTIRKFLREGKLKGWKSPGGREWRVTESSLKEFTKGGGAGEPDRD